MVTTLAQCRRMHSTKLDLFSSTCLEEAYLCLGLLNIALSINVGCDIHKGMVTVRVRCRKKESLCGLLSSLEQRLLVMTPAQNAFTWWDTERLACWAKGLNQWTLTSCIHFKRGTKSCSRKGSADFDTRNVMALMPRCKGHKDYIQLQKVNQSPFCI